MKSVAFSIARVNRLRRAAERARMLPVAERPGGMGRPDGWFVSAWDANRLLRVFDTLRLKAGFALHAYVLGAGDNGNGVIWAVPTDAPVVAVEECPRLDEWLAPPRPPAAVPFMQAIEGDGSPWSYLSASILRREAEEFGAEWHGVNWSDHTIISRPPPQADGQDISDEARELTGEPPAGDWQWNGEAPRTWKPLYTDRGATREVVLHSYSALVQEAIYQATDTYSAGSLDCKTEITTLCTGGPGYIH